MSSYAIGTWLFEFWQGPPPVLPYEQVVEHVRPGINGVGQQRVGRWAQQFETVVVAHWPTMFDGLTAYAGYRLLSGAGPVDVVYNGFNYTTGAGVRFLVNRVEPVRISAHPRLIGPGYDFPGGTEVVARFFLTPQEVPSS